MLNYIWAGMILLGVIYGVCTGQMSALTEGALDSAGEAVSLCITMAGVMALWMGLMEIAQESGMITKMTKGIRPFLKFMFPRLPEDHPAGEYIATNLIANVLGLGWACTPAGLKAMEQLAELEGGRRGIYGGAIGYLDFSGNLDVCIAIRIAYAKKGKVYARSGAGIVADSVPESEYQECLNKARAVILAVKKAEEGMES